MIPSVGVCLFAFTIPCLTDMYDVCLAGTAIPVVKLPQSITRLYVPIGFGSVEQQSTTTVQHAVSSLRKNTTLGIDLEYTPRVAGSRVDTLQLASSDTVVVFHLATELDRIPQELLELLQDTNITKVGFNVQGDLTRLANRFPADCKQSATDSGAQLTQRWSVKDLRTELKTAHPNLILKGGKHTLVSYCLAILRCGLNKDQQMTTWHMFPLNQAQLEYAYLDAFVTLMMYEKEFGAPIADVPPQQPQAFPTPGLEDKGPIRRASNVHPMAVGAASVKGSQGKKHKSKSTPEKKPKMTRAVGMSRTIAGAQVLQQRRLQVYDRYAVLQHDTPLAMLSHSMMLLHVAGISAHLNCEF
jgi:hypothetical protein